MHSETKSPALRVGVVGVGSLGQHHARVYSQLPGVLLVGVADIHQARTEEIARKFHCLAFTDCRELVDRVDAVSVVVPTAAHFETARIFLAAGKSILLEKPMTRTLEEADELIRLARDHGAVLQIGHIERFNEAIQALKKNLDQPRFVEVHRLGPFSRRNTDIGVVLDLMIHDIDIILDLVGAQVEKVEAVGVKVLSDHEDIANARLTLTNGCVANITASRVTLDSQRKIRVFSPRSYISLDYQKQEFSIYQLKPDTPPEETNLMRMINREHRAFGKKEPLVAELAAFVQAVREGREPEVTGEAGRQALAVALEISRQIRSQAYSAQ